MTKRQEAAGLQGCRENENPGFLTTMHHPEAAGDRPATGRTITCMYLVASQTIDLILRVPRGRLSVAVGTLAPGSGCGGAHPSGARGPFVPSAWDRPPRLNQSQARPILQILAEYDVSYQTNDMQATRAQNGYTPRAHLESN